MEHFPRMGSALKKESKERQERMRNLLWDMESNGSADYELEEEYVAHVARYEQEFGPYERAVSEK